MPPSASGRLSAFAVLVRLAPEQGSGGIVRFASADGSYVFALGLKDGKPYVESQAAGKTQTSTALSSVPSGPLTLEAVFKPEGNALSVSWWAEGERIDAPSLPLPSAPPAGGAALGGAGSLPGVYDGFGLMVAGSSSAYPSPAYRLASRRLWKSSLIIAEGFEDELPQPSSIVLAPDFGIGAGIVVEATIDGDRASCALEFSTPEGERVFAVRGTGEVLSASGKAIGSIPVTGARMSFSLELRDGKLYIVGAGRATELGIPGSAKRFVLSLKREAGANPSNFDRVLVRFASASEKA
jgi:hypothetical protein